MSAASFAAPTLRVVSRNHSTGSSSSGGAVSTTWTADTVIGSAPSMASVAGSVTWRKRSSQFASRLQREGRTFFLLDLGRAVSPSTSTSIRPSGAPLRMVANSFGFPLPRTRSCFARTSRSTRAERRCASNSSNTSASRSHTEITRVLPPTSRTARAMSVKPSSHRRVFRRVSAAAGRFSSGSKPSLHIPSGRPVSVTAIVACRRSPWLFAPVWFLPINCNPSQPGRVAKFRSVPSWIASTVPCERICCTLRSRSFNGPYLYW